MSIINLVPTFTGRIAKYGERTLLFYLLHTFAIESLKALQLPMGYLPSLIYAFGITIILCIVSNIKGIDKFLTPISSFVSFQGKIW